jgi:[protein-PII] uridylyltransferase
MTQTITRRDDLICPADDIFHISGVETRLAQAVSDSGGDMTALRAAVVELLGAEMKRGREAIAAGFAEHPFAARPVTRAYCWLTDCVILTVLDVATRVMHPLPNPTEAERLAVFAVGGYGRGEMAPQSDVDLLFLTPYKITPWAESVIESMLYILWDLRLKVGHAPLYSPP